MKVVVLNNQSLPDLSIQKLGTIEGMIDLAFLNGKSLTDELVAGESLTLPEFEIDARIANYFEAFSLRPATGLTQEQEEILDNVDPCDLCKCFL
mgnify:CR=1 FL=1